MKLGRCPVCHASINLDALVQDEAGSELLRMVVGMDADIGRWSVQYVGLWRPAKSDLSNARALRLLKETLALSTDKAKLCAALQATVTAIHKKRLMGENLSALDSHAYLKRVLDTTQHPQGGTPTPTHTPPADDAFASDPTPPTTPYKPPTAISPNAKPPTKEQQAQLSALLDSVKRSMTATPQKRTQT